MMATDKIEETIKEIAAKHGIAVGRDDPILILQTINERLMQDSATAQQEILDRFKEEMESIAHRWGDDAKNKAERTLNAALTVSRETMLTTMQDGAKAAAESLRHEVESTTTRLASSIRESRRVAIMNLIAASMTFFAVGLALWALM
uniref:conjugal transfer protein TraM n=1 Tax=Methylobacter luteus TaxID=415 RepID=UPI000489F043|nr:conjugal transfer protein TraM [Methylobacter luteus]